MTAILLIDSDGHRLLSKYYQPAHVDPKATGPVAFKNPFQSDKEKRAFEQAVWDKTRRSQGKSTKLTVGVVVQRTRARASGEF